jgi:hypothetical protein
VRLPEEETMTAQPMEQPGDSRVRRVPRTIRGIADALPVEYRRTFLRDVMAAEEGDPVLEVMRRGHAEAMLAQVPGHQEHLEQALRGIGLLPLPDLIEAEA